MEHSFWHERWESGRIAFHEGAPNSLLTNHWPAMGLSAPRVFVPLCGKAVDLAWLAAQGCTVVGAELDQRAVEDFFAENGIEADVSSVGALRLYASPQISIYQGDIFELTAATLGAVDAVFDRAALVALPRQMRVSYAKHLVDLTAKAPQLLITYEYSNPDMQGPPHSVVSDEVRQHYSGQFEVVELERREITGPLRERTDGSEAVYKLTPL